MGFAASALGGHASAPARAERSRANPRRGGRLVGTPDAGVAATAVLRPLLRYELRDRARGRGRGIPDRLPVTVELRRGLCPRRRRVAGRSWQWTRPAALPPLRR